MKSKEIKEILNDSELNNLYDQLLRIHTRLREFTKNKYNKVNPFNEELFDWKEKGEFFGGKEVTIYDSAFITGDVEIGENTWIGPFTSIDGSGGLKIGRFCSIASGVRIMTHDTAKWALSGGKAAADHNTVTIGDCCFIGVNSVITRGVNIGKHCLIGAGSIVAKDISDFSIAVGNPAKIIGKVKVDGEKVEYIYF